jgi:hypothetical protein
MTSKETKLTALNMKAQGIGQDIERAENRALKICPEYNKDNVFWKCVIELEEENDLVKQMVNGVIESPQSTTSKRKRPSVVDLFGEDSFEDQGNDETSTCKKPRAGSLPVAQVSYVDNSSASTSSGLTPVGPADQADQVDSAVSSNEETLDKLAQADVASSMLGIANS